MNKSIFVTNGTGLLGSHFILDQLMNSEADIYCLVQKRDGESPGEGIRGTVKKAFSASYETGSEADNIDKKINERIFPVEGDVSLENLGIDHEAVEESSIDEVWHIAGSGRPGSLEACPGKSNAAATRNLLAFATRKKIPVINYVGTAYDAEAPPSAGPAEASDSACASSSQYGARAGELEIMRQCQSGGLAFRILKPSLIVGPSKTFNVDGSYGFYGFFSLLLNFKEYIENRIPDYFRFNGLNISLKPEASLNLICVDHAARIMSQVAESKDTLNSHFDIANPEDVNICTHLKKVSPALGMEVKCCDGPARLNPVDELFHAAAETMIRCFEDSRTFDSHKALEFSELKPAELIIDSQKQMLMAQKFVDWFTENRKSLDSKVRASVESLERKRLKLAGGEELNYYVGGAGDQSITIINAYGQSIYYWEPLVAKLLEKYRVIIWLARGTSGQSSVGEFYPIGDHAEDLKKILQNENIEKNVLLGWCTGSKLALEFYSKYPDAVSQMIFLGGAFKNLKGMEDLYTKYEQNLEPLLDMVHKKPQLAGSLISYLKGVILGKASDIKSINVNSPESRDQVIEMLSSVNSKLQPHVVGPFTDQVGLVKYAKQLADFWNHDVSNSLKAVKAPVLFISGELDSIASAAISKEVSRMVPGSKYIEVKGGTHYLQFENVELLSDIIDRFLTEGWSFSFGHSLVSAHA
ncbi:MAG: alpha/beta fold hydrolase [Blastocatellia bacterium]